MSNIPFPVDYIPNSDPFVEFELWLEKAIASDEIEPTAMSLATVANGRPRCRLVLYKGLSQGGLTFYTNYESNKALELDGTPYAAATFHWKTLTLQLRVEGRTQKTSRIESENYFATRPRDSQIGAWVSQQSRMLSSRKDLEQKKLEIEEKFKDQNKILCPPFWGGYRIIPDLFEFWICEPGRLHNRFQYTLSKGHWIQKRLYP